MKIGKLEGVPVVGRLDLLAKPVVEAIQKLKDTEDISVTEIDPQLADTDAFCDFYEIPLDQAVNCIIVEATSADRKWFVACLVLANTRADINSTIRKYLKARKVSFANPKSVVATTRMEYGGITPVGLPPDWPLLVDSRIIESDRVIIGSGIRGSKLIVQGKLFDHLPNVAVLNNLAKDKAS